MSDSSTPNQNDRSLQRALTNKIIDEYFAHTESWLRAILRMSIFSLTQIDAHPAFMIECPNQAVAKRLSRKIYPLQQAAQYFIDYSSNQRILICYKQVNQTWRCFDTNTNTWKTWENPQTPTAPADN